MIEGLQGVLQFLLAVIWFLGVLARELLYLDRSPYCYLENCISESKIYITKYIVVLKASLSLVFSEARNIYMDSRLVVELHLIVLMVLSSLARSGAREWSVDELSSVKIKLII